MNDAQAMADRFMRALNARDFETMVTMLDEDVALDSMTGLRTIGAEPLRMAVMTYLRHFDETFEDIVFMYDPFGQRVAVDATARGHYRETMAGFPAATGQSYAVASVFVLELEDGAISRLSHYRNTRLFERLLAG